MQGLSMKNYGHSNQLRKMQEIQNLGISEIRKHGFWFVDIPRTSSSSIRVELGEHFGNAFGKSIHTECKSTLRQVFTDHITAQQMKQLVGPVLWRKLFTFSFVRNPWDRLVSMYFYRLGKGHFTEELTFSTYVQLLEDSIRNSTLDMFAYHGFHLGCYDYLFDEYGNDLVSFIGRYENRRKDLSEISQMIGCSQLGELCISKSPQEKLHYSTYYDEETKSIVEDIYEKDISVFGYTFESTSCY